MPPSISYVSNFSLSSPRTLRSSILKSKLSSDLWSLSLASEASINGVPPIKIVPLGPLHYPINIGGEPAYLGLGRRKGVPGRPRLVLVPLQIFPYISNLLTKPSGDLVPGIILSLPHLSHHPLGLVNIPYKRFGPVPGFVHLGRPQYLPKNPPSRQQVIYTCLHLRVRQFPIPLNLPGVPLCI